MKTYVLEAIKRIKRFSEKFDVSSTLCDKTWVVFNDTGEREIYIFQPNGSVIITKNGVGIKGKWEWISTNKSLVINSNDKVIMLHPEYIDKTVLALTLDGTYKMVFLIEQGNKSSFAPKTLTELEQYFIDKEERLIAEEKRIKELNERRRKEDLMRFKEEVRRVKEEYERKQHEEMIRIIAERQKQEEEAKKRQKQEEEKLRVEQEKKRLEKEQQERVRKQKEREQIMARQKQEAKELSAQIDKLLVLISNPIVNFVFSILILGCFFKGKIINNPWLLFVLLSICALITYALHQIYNNIHIKRINEWKKKHPNDFRNIYLK